MADGFYTFEDAFTFAQKMAAAPKVVEAETVTAANRLAVQGEGWVKPLTPVRTGTLRRSIAAQPARFSGGVARSAFGTATPYAPWVEDGRGPVVARSGGMLRFIPKGSSTPIYRRRVGPAKGHKMFERTRQRLIPMVPREFSVAMRRVLAKIGGQS